MRNIKMSQSELNFRREYMRFENTIKALGQFEGTVVNEKYIELKRELDEYVIALDKGIDVNKSKLQGVATRLKNLRGGGKSRSNQLYTLIDTIDVETGEIYEGSGYSAKLNRILSPHDVTSFSSAIYSLRPSEYSEPTTQQTYTETYYEDVPQNVVNNSTDYSTSVLNDVWDWIHKKPPQGIVSDIEQKLVEIEARYGTDSSYEERIANLFEQHADTFDAIYYDKVSYDDIDSMLDVIDFIDEQLDIGINGNMNDEFEAYEQW